MELTDSQVFRAMQRVTLLQYQKILYIDLTEDFYSVLKVENKEWDIQIDMNDTQSLSEWFQWFAESPLCHDEDRHKVRTVLSAQYLRKTFDSNDQRPISVSYRRRNTPEDTEYQVNRLELVPEMDEHGHLIAFLFIHVDEQAAEREQNNPVMFRQYSETNQFIQHYANNARRTVLVIEDNPLNRDLLKELLIEDYDVLEASNGQEGLEIFRRELNRISLILLDVFMPVMDGFEFLKQVSEDKYLGAVPILVTTSSNSQEDEAQCLQLGATDYITKPYVPEIVKMRVAANIKLYESSAAVSAVEVDSNTGLYTKEAFYHQLNRVLRTNPSATYNIVVSVVDNYRSISEQYGPYISKQVLSHVGKAVRKLMTEREFFAAQIRDNMFASVSVAKPSSVDPAEGMRRFNEAVLKNSPVRNVVIKNSIYEAVDTSCSGEVLVERAASALEEIRYQYGKDIIFYDATLIAKQAKESEMSDSFADAIEGEQFEVWYQPKYATDTEHIIGAEALVRWRAADGHMISPGEFIPLFEKNGLIHILDEYVFRKVCEFQKKQKENNKAVIPISVNLSRASMYRSDIVKCYDGLLRQYGLMPSMIPIEITETAAIHSNSVRELAENLIDEGFNLHMDDFGSGYSSLASLQILDFETIKLDKSLIDFIGTPGGNSLLKHTIAYAKEAGMRVVAEGVENELQLQFLKNTKCDAIQGFYFSRPVPEVEFCEKLQEQMER